MTALPRTLALLGALLAVYPDPSAAQVDRDSIAALRLARQEQARFEMVRRRNLPSTFGGGGGECDERIGRFCLTRDTEETWVPPPEPAAVAPARDRLLQHLTAAAQRIPGDRWVTGQRVRYLVEAKRFTEARAAALECRAEAWWCAALEGAATHYAGAAAAADSAFTRMLTAMPAPVREQWTDLTDVLEPRLARHFRRLQPVERERFVDTYWALADPFFSRPGSEVRAEHFARNVLDDLQDRAEATDNLRWGSDLREILLRFGWPTGWERIERRPYAMTQDSYVSHYADVDRDILPPPEIFLDSAGLAAGDWDAETAGARATYAVPLGDSLVSWLPTLEYQVARFYRGDSAVVVAAYALPPDSVPEGMEASLVTTSDGSTIGPVARIPGAGATAALRVTAAPQPMVASLELVAEDAHRAARARAGVVATPLEPGRLAVSDLLLLRDGLAPPESLEGAIAQARGSTSVRAGESVGVYWEIYGLGGRPTGELSMTLRIVSGARGWLRRLAERARIVRAAEPVQLRWQEPLPGGSVLSRALGVQIPDVSPGEYAIELSVSMAGDEPLVARQVIEVAAAPK